MKRFVAPIGIGWPNKAISSGKKAKFVESSTHSKQNAAVLCTVFEIFSIFDALVNTTTAGERIYSAYVNKLSDQERQKPIDQLK